MCASATHVTSSRAGIWMAVSRRVDTLNGSNCLGRDMSRRKEEDVACLLAAAPIRCVALAWLLGRSSGREAGPPGRRTSIQPGYQVRALTRPATS